MVRPPTLNDAQMHSEAPRDDVSYTCNGMRQRSERPTVPPSFDVAQYASESDARWSAPFSKRDEELPAPNSEVRLTTQPYWDKPVSDEAWAQAMEGTPSVSISSEELKRLPLGHRAGFLLSRLDGATDLETLVELAAMPRDETLRLLRDLFQRGVVTFR